MIKNTTTKPSNLGDVLFNASHRRLLELFLLAPHRSFHLREIGRRTGISPGSLHRELKLFTDAGLLQRTKIGNQVHYQVDAAYPALKEVTVAFRKLAEPGGSALKFAESSPAHAARHLKRRRKIPAALDRLNVQKRALTLLCRRHHVDKLSFFGSVTREDFTPESDVDVLVEFSPEFPTTFSDLVELREDLSQLFGGRAVDVATPAILQNPYRRAAIQKDIQTAYAVG